MDNLKKLPVSENYFTGVLLAIVGGYFDAYTYIIRDGVFANAQTGNIVLMGISVANNEYLKALYYVIPILAFIFGIILTEIIKAKCFNSKLIHWRQLVLLIEMILTIVVAFIPCAYTTNIIANIIVSFVCAMQVKGFKKINGNAVATTMCTGNLRSASELLFDTLKNKNRTSFKKSLQYFGIIIFFVFGAIIGSLITEIFLEKSILFLTVIFIILFVAMFKKSDF